MIACVVFDFDGVLVDSNAMKRRAYFDIFAPLGPTASIVQGVLASTRDGDRYQVIGRILRELTTTGLLPDVGEQERLLQDYAGRYNAICEDFAATCCEISGASTSLERLAGRYALYINSATPEEPLRRIVARRGWERWFRAVLSHGKG
jgi:phosphoglycolate phosphatase-like HAD superfamily hydrolase